MYMLDDFGVLLSRKVGRKTAIKLNPDPVYGNLYVSKLVNKVMRDGKKAIAYNHIVLPALANIKDKHGEDPCQVLADAINNVRPSVELARASARSHYSVPTPIKPARSLSMAFRFLVDAARKQSKTGRVSDVLYRVLYDAANNRGAAVERKNNLHSAAAANNAFKAFDGR